MRSVRSFTNLLHLSSRPLWREIIERVSTRNAHSYHLFSNDGRAWGGAEKATSPRPELRAMKTASAHCHGLLATHAPIHLRIKQLTATYALTSSAFNMRACIRSTCGPHMPQPPMRHFHGHKSPLHRATAHIGNTQAMPRLSFCLNASASPSPTAVHRNATTPSHTDRGLRPIRSTSSPPPQIPRRSFASHPSSKSASSSATPAETAAHMSSRQIRPLVHTTRPNAASEHITATHTPETLHAHSESDLIRSSRIALLTPPPPVNPGSLVVYYADHAVVPLPDKHRFPMLKYAATRQALASDPSLTHCLELRPGPEASLADVLAVHDSAYVERFTSGHLTTEEMRNVGFPWSKELVGRITYGSLGQHIYIM